MATWNDVSIAAPELAQAVRELFEAHKHLTIATLRKDGAPRISGIECRFIEGDLWFGSMPNAVKALDLQRDPRFALHSGSADPPDWTADAKVAGSALEVTEPGADSHRFRLDIAELVVTSMGDPRDHIVIESWHEGRGIERRTRT